MGDTQVIEFLNARQALKTAEEHLEEIRFRAERLAKSLEDWYRPDAGRVVAAVKRAIA